jgi:uncharacterized protein (TIRG00374 family)
LILPRSHYASAAPVLRTLFALGLVAYLTLSGVIDWSALLLLAENWILSGAAFGLLCLVSLLVSIRLTLLLGAQGFRLPLSAALRLSLIGGLFSAFLPGAAGGDIARMYLAARPNPGRRTELVTVIALDRFVGLLSVLAIPILVGFWLKASVTDSHFIVVRGLLLSAALGFTAGVLAILSCWSERLRVLMTSLLARIRLAEHGERLFQTISAYREKPGTLISAFVLSVFTQIAVVAALVLLVMATGGSAITWAMILVIPFGHLANALPFTPGGLGVGEAAFATLFASVGAAGGAEAILAWRVLTSLLDLAGGGILMAGRIDMPLAEHGVGRRRNDRDRSRARHTRART